MWLYGFFYGAFCKYLLVIDYGGSIDRIMNVYRVELVFSRGFGI